MRIIQNSLFSISLVSIGLLVSVTANAGFLVEPHIGYNLHSSTKVGTDTLSSHGGQYGARLGFQHLGIMGGLDYTHAIYITETKPSSGTSDFDEKKRDELGVFVGYKFPVLLRAWMGYNFLAKESQSKLGPTSGNAIGNYNKGHSTELGLGFTGFPFISINLSYKMISYDKNYDPTNNKTSVLNPKIAPKEVILGISLPLNLP